MNSISSWPSSGEETRCSREQTGSQYVFFWALGSLVVILVTAPCSEELVRVYFRYS